VILGETGDLGAGIYAHSSFLSEDSRYLFVFEETNTFDMGVFDVSNPSNISLVTTFSYSDDTARNAIVHNGQVRGNFLFVAYYEAGFRVFDISDPANPVERGKFETYFDPDDTGELINFPFRGTYRGAWNVYSFLPSGNILVTDMQTGLFVLQIVEKEVQHSVSNLWSL
jgi:choice-of-anchor B domain-containing protein